MQCWPGWLTRRPLTLLIPLLVGALALAIRYLAGVVRPATGEAADEAWPTTEKKQPTIAGGAIPASWATEHLFVLILVFVAALLLFGTELVYLKDAFDNRMNTVFKLYFQSWEMLAVAAAYAVYYLGSGWFEKRGAGVEKSRVGARPPPTSIVGDSDVRPHPNPLPRGEGTAGRHCQSQYLPCGALSG